MKLKRHCSRKACIHKIEKLKFKIRGQNQIKSMTLAGILNRTIPEYITVKKIYTGVW